jgi:spore coat protein U-like protein
VPLDEGGRTMSVRRAPGARCALQGLLVCAAMAAGGTAQAAATCTVTAVGPAFGAYNPLNPSPTLSNGSVTASCQYVSGGTTTVALVSSYSAGSSGSYASRTMLSGLNRLSYNLYFDAAFTQVRGDGTGGSQTGGATLTVSSASRTATATSVIYGRIPASQNAVPGSYLDTIMVTITY